jgi:hypothetical protein
MPFLPQLFFFFSQNGGVIGWWGHNGTKMRGREEVNGTLKAAKWNARNL